MRSTIPVPRIPVPRYLLGLRSPRSYIAFAAGTLFLAPGVGAQAFAEAIPNEPVSSNFFVARVEPAPLATSESSIGLPDAPGVVAGALASQPSSSSVSLVSDSTASGHKPPKPASPTDLVILPGQIAPRQSVRDKVIGSVRDSISPFSIAGELVSAGYSQAVNNSPNYGTNATAFGQRFGASVARGTSQKLFYQGATASILREDPRYYKMGRNHPFFKRLIYAGTRPLITRTDGGKRTPNFALLSGYLGAAALTKVYYPQPNQGFDETLQTYGGSIGGAALGYVVSEFLSDALQIVHLEKKE